MSRGANIELPWPPRELHPNARPHHMQRAKAARAYRATAFETTSSWAWDWSNLRCTDGDGPILVDLTFHPPDRRRRDLDGMLSNIKSALDGIADALGVNDNRFEFRLRRAEPVKNGRVVVVLGEAE